MLQNRSEGYLPIQSVPSRTVRAERKTDQSGGCYDKLSLSREGVGDSRFLREAASLSQQVRTTNTTGKIQELRRQVQSGEYHPDARETAARMLLMGEVQE